MNTYAILKNFFEFSWFDVVLFQNVVDDFLRITLFVYYFFQFILSESSFLDVFRSFISFFPRMNEHEHLMFWNSFWDFLIQNFIDECHFFYWFFLCNPYELLFKRNWSIRIVKIIDSLSIFGSYKVSDVLIIRQSSWECYDSNELLCLFNGSDCPTYNSFDHRSSVIVKEVDFIDDYKLYNVQERLIGPLSSDDVPLFWSCNNYLSFSNLLFIQMDVSSQFLDLNVEGIQAFLKVVNDFGH